MHHKRANRRTMMMMRKGLQRRLTSTISGYLSFKGNKALGDCPPSQFEPPGDWPKVYTPEGLQNYFPMGVTAEDMSRQPLPSLIIVVPPNSPQLEKEHFLDHLHSHEALQRYSLGVGKLRKQFAFCPYCGIRSENQVSAYSHAR